MSTSSEAQRGTVIQGIISGSALTAGLFIAGYCNIPDRQEALETPVQRLVFTLRWQCLSVLTFMFGICRIANKRFLTTAIDPISGKGQTDLEVDKRYLQNTFEQFVLSIVGQLILSTFLHPSTASRVIPSLVILFVCGRILFWIGYRMSPLRRATGFAMTFYPSAVVTFINVWFLLSRGPHF